jgi:hypothetical protein
MPEPKFRMDVVRENNGIIASWLLSFFVLWSGVITSVIGFINRDFVVVWVGAGLFAISWIIKLPQIFSRDVWRKEQTSSELKKSNTARERP